MKMREVARMFQAEFRDFGKRIVFITMARSSLSLY